MNRAWSDYLDQLRRAYANVPYVQAGARGPSPHGEFSAGYAFGLFKAGQYLGIPRDLRLLVALWGEQLGRVSVGLRADMLKANEAMRGVSA